MYIQNKYNSLSEEHKGILLSVAGGAILLLYIFGILQRGLALIVIVGGLYMIALGLYKLEIHKKAMALINKHKD